MSEAQKQPCDVTMIYDNVKNRQKLDQELIGLGSVEPNKLNAMMLLMRIRKDGMLVVRFFTTQQTRELIVSQNQMRK